MLIRTKTESSIFTSITNIRPTLSRLMFKMFKVFVRTKLMATPQELVLPREKNNCPPNSSFHILSSLTEDCVS